MGKYQVQFIIFTVKRLSCVSVCSFVYALWMLCVVYGCFVLCMDVAVSLEAYVVIASMSLLGKAFFPFLFFVLMSSNKGQPGHSGQIWQKGTVGQTQWSYTSEGD